MLQKMKCSSDMQDMIARYVWMTTKVIAVDVRGAIGGLALLWDSKVIILEDFFLTPRSISTTFLLLGMKEK